MYNLQAIISQGMNNATTQMDQLGYVANNVTNYNTNGYKAVRFEQMLNGNGYLTGSIRTDYSNGSLVVTKKTFDVGINGAGFIPVTSKEGQTAYTRDGSFRINKDGYLTTNDDWIVGGGIKIPTNYYKIDIKKNGDVMAMLKSGDQAQKIGTIPLVNFANPEGLKEGDNNKLLATADSGSAKLVKNHEEINQYSLEHSNTDLYAQVNSMLRINASMIASIQMIKVMDDMYNKSINIRQS